MHSFNNNHLETQDCTGMGMQTRMGVVAIGKLYLFLGPTLWTSKGDN